MLLKLFRGSGLKNVNKAFVKCRYYSNKINPGDKDDAKNKQQSEKLEDSGSSTSFFGHLKQLFSNRQRNEANDKWMQQYAEIKSKNHFDLDINPENKEQFSYFKAVSIRKYNWMNVLIASHEPLRYHEFMIGAYDGMQFVLQCLQQNDREGLKSCVTLGVLDQFDEMKKLMFDEEYGNVGKMMCFLKEFENAPNFEDMSINARFTVTYYYQLFKTEDESEQQSDDYIQQRVDVIWTSLWSPSDGHKFKISENGWTVDAIECTKIERTKTK